MPYTPTYRYAIGIFGANYAQAGQTEPEHWAMAESIEQARNILDHMRAGVSYAETGAGERTLDTPGYGYEGDGAYVYRVDRDHPDFSEVLDEPGDRARHAFGYVDFDYPAYLIEFGPRGGVQVTRA